MALQDSDGERQICIASAVHFAPRYALDVTMDDHPGRVVSDSWSTLTEAETSSGYSRHLMSETGALPPPIVAPTQDPSNMQGMSDRVAKLDFTKVTIGLLVAATLGGFALLAMQISRMDGRISALESRLDIVSAKMAEMSSVYQRELQASTDKLTALINATRQTPNNMQPVPTRSEAPGSIPQNVETPRQPGPAPASLNNSIPIPPMPQGAGRILRR